MVFCRSTVGVRGYWGGRTGYERKAKDGYENERKAKVSREKEKLRLVKRMKGKLSLV